jgi:hypothetical protein
MLIQVRGFGSSWWARFGPDPDDRYRFTRHAAYFNSTGLRCGSKLRRFWAVPGLLRFNSNGSFNPDYPDRSIGRTFECNGSTTSFVRNRNRLLFIRRVLDSQQPDYYLVLVSSEHHGRIHFAEPAWKSDTVVVFSVSHFRERSEAMLLMKLDGCVRSSLGTWRLEKISGNNAELMLCE